MLLDLIRKRRSIRKYQKKAIEPEKRALLIEAALRAPSSRRLNPWEFILVTKTEVLALLAQAKPHNSFVQNAPLVIVVCADPARCDVWIEDVSITATYIQLAAESLGLGSCWVQIRERRQNETKSAEEYLREVLKIPEKLKVEALIAIGYPDETLPSHSQAELQYEKVFYEQYGEKDG